MSADFEIKHQMRRGYAHKMQYAVHGGLHDRGDVASHVLMRVCRRRVCFVCSLQYLLFTSEVDDGRCWRVVARETRCDSTLQQSVGNLGFHQRTLYTGSEKDAPWHVVVLGTVVSEEEVAPFFDQQSRLAVSGVDVVFHENMHKLGMYEHFVQNAVAVHSGVVNALVSTTVVDVLVAIQGKPEHEIIHHHVEELMCWH